MELVRRTVVPAIAAALLWAAPALARDICVGDAAECEDTLALALEAARMSVGPDRVLLAGGEHLVPDGVADAPGEPVEIVGTGPATQLTGALWLDQTESRAAAMMLADLRTAGISTRLAATGDVQLLAGARMSDSLVLRTLRVTSPARVERTLVRVTEGPAISTGGGAGALVLENVAIDVGTSETGALDVACSTVTARHLTITGSAARVADVVCEEPEKSSLDLRDSVVHGDFPEVVTAPAGEVSSARSAHDADPEIVATERIEVEDPRFVSDTDRRLRPDSPLVDAGEPGVLGTGEGFWDLGNRARVTDGNGDGILRRDVGAHELQPPPVEVPAGNVLHNPGAETGTAIASTVLEGPEPAAWTRTGGFTQVGYGTVARTATGLDVTLPTREAGAALGAGNAFFSAGPGEGARLLQRIDVAASAREIDSGLASAGLAGLLGGYGADEDEVRVTATFRDPEGGSLAVLSLGPVSPAERANATNLLYRSAAGAIPARTRAIDVEVAGVRISAPGSSETYTDAYADNLSLVLSVPGVPVPGPVDPDTQPPVKNLRPFSGVTVLTGKPRLSRTGRTKIRLACASATVGRCRGSLELRAQLRRGQAFTRIAQFAKFTVAPGRAATVTVKLTLAARRALRRARSFRATLRAVAQDGQGLQRRTTIPVRVRR